MVRFRSYLLRQALLLAFLGALVAAATAVAGDEQPPATRAVVVARETIQGRGIQWWQRRAVQARKDANARARTIRELRRELAADTTIQNAIDLAATAYHVSATMLSRKAACESTGGHGYNAAAVGAPISDGERPVGLFQFLPSTWRSTPFARFSPYDPLAAALGAGWMHSVGRGGEWQCR